VNIVEITQVLLPLVILADGVDSLQKIPLPVGIEFGRDTSQLANLLEASSVAIVDLAEIDRRESVTVSSGPQVIVGDDLFGLVG
jgi:hypothetical protein